METKRKSQFSISNRFIVNGAAMAKARVAADVSLRQLAEKLGTDKSNVSRWERGLKTPSDEHILAIAEILENWGFIRGNPHRGVDRRKKGGWAKPGRRKVDEHRTDNV